MELVYNGETAQTLAEVKKEKNKRRWHLKETTEKRKYHSVEVLPYLVANSIIINEPKRIRKRKAEQTEHESLMEELALFILNLAAPVVLNIEN